MNATTPGIPRPLPARAVGILGRTAELSRIRALLPDRRIDGVAVSGVGRSRVLAEIADWAQGHGFRVEPITGGRGLSALVCTVLLGPATRVLAVVDDAHLLSEADTELLLELVRQGLVRVLAAGPDGLWQGENLGRVDLPPLGATDMAELARAITGDHPAARRLAQLAKGSPRLLRELVHLAADHPADQGGSLAEVIELRLAGLETGQRQALDLIAAAGFAPLPVFERLVDRHDLIILAEQELITAVETPTGWRVELAHNGIGAALGAIPAPEPSTEDDQDHATGLMCAGRIEEALGAARDRFAEADAAHRSRHGLILAAMLLAHGQIRRAYDLLCLLPDGDPRWAILRLAAAAQLGDPAAVAASALPEASATHLAASAAVARAWAAAVRGDLDEARDLLCAKAEDTTWDRALRAHTLGRLGLARSAAPFWHSIGQHGYLRARLDYSRAIATADADLLAAVAEQFLTAGALLYGAEALAELAALHQRAGQPRKAAAAIRRARMLPVRHSGARTPGLALLAQNEPLSTRESEVVRLAVSGLTDPQIALRLGVSVRTINNHLHRAYRKLGCAGRVDLPPGAGQ
ncbi:helix-turn-helix transcriptional regulator [Crossiella sp. CA198]|uniref:helix-turn-helix transcriptional regulator n=1 Tax=Crossiella sp. CA198 TaxID=3455607 RepID=UPI003F8D16BC